MKNKINITVSGITGSGKSTIAYLIKECLKNRGFDIDFNGGIDFIDENQFDKSMELHLDNRVEVIKSKSELYLSEIQTHRPLFMDDEE